MHFHNKFCGFENEEIKMIWMELKNKDFVKISQKYKLRNMKEFIKIRFESYIPYKCF